MRSAEVTGTLGKMWSEPSVRSGPVTCVSVGVEAVESRLACVNRRLVYPSDAATAIVCIGPEPPYGTAVAAATGSPEESRAAMLTIGRSDSPSRTCQLPVSSVPSMLPPSNVTTVSVLLRVSATNGSPYVASATHVVPAASASVPTVMPPAGTVYVIVGGCAPAPRAACDISTVLPALSASVAADVPPWAEMPETALSVGVLPVLSVTAQSAAASVAVTSPVNVTSVVSPSVVSAVKRGMYIADVEPPAKAMPTSLLTEDGVTV